MEENLYGTWGPQDISLPGSDTLHLVFAGGGAHGVVRADGQENGTVILSNLSVTGQDNFVPRIRPKGYSGFVDFTAYSLLPYSHGVDVTSDGTKAIVARQPYQTSQTSDTFNYAMDFYEFALPNIATARFQTLQFSSQYDYMAAYGYGTAPPTFGDNPFFYSSYTLQFATQVDTRVSPDNRSYYICAGVLLRFDAATLVKQAQSAPITASETDDPNTKFIVYEHIALSGDGSRLIATGRLRFGDSVVVYVHDAVSLARTSRLDTLVNGVSEFSDINVAASGNSAFYATALYGNGKVQLFSTATNERIATFDLPGALCVNFSLDSTRLYATGTNRFIAIDTATLAIIGTYATGGTVFGVGLATGALGGEQVGLVSNALGAIITAVNSGNDVQFYRNRGGGAPRDTLGKIPNAKNPSIDINAYGRIGALVQSRADKQWYLHESRDSGEHFV